MKMQASSNGFPFLSIMLLVLLTASVLIWLFRDSRQARWVAMGATLLDLLLAMVLLWHFDSSNQGFQFIEQRQWIPTLNISYLVGVDGISILFLPMTQLLFLGVIVASWTSVRAMPQLYFSLLLLLQAVNPGDFLCTGHDSFFPFLGIDFIASLLPDQPLGYRTGSPLRCGELHAVDAGGGGTVAVWPAVVGI